MQFGQSLDEIDDVLAVLRQHERPSIARVAPPSPARQPESRLLQFKPWGGSFVLPAEEFQIPESSQLDEEDEKEPWKLLEAKEGEKAEGYFFRFQTGSVRLIKGLLEENGFKQAYFRNQKWTIYWSCGPVRSEVYCGLESFQRVNQFPNSFHLTRKDLMHRNISKMQIKFGPTHFNFIPKTFILPGELGLLEADFSKGGRTYIVKPHNRSQGKGISVTRDYDDILDKLQKYASLVVSHYVDSPMLINGLKFDLRIYVALTSLNPLKVYIYEEGLARFATEAYSSEAGGEGSRFVHLTNYSVNKKNENFEAPTEDEEYFGSKWSLTSLVAFLKAHLGKGETELLLERIDDLVIKSVLSIENTLYTSFEANVPYVNNCFQVYGFDVLVDSNLKPWLLEVNLSPSLNTDSPLDLKIKGAMVADLITLSGVLPVDLRFVNGNHLRYEKSKYFNLKRAAVTEKYQFSPFDLQVIRDFESEGERSRAWRRIFPTLESCAKYKNYFQKDRPLNALLREYLQRKVRPVKRR